MKRADAHQLLDAARAGRAISADLITLALQVTGDLQPLRLFDRNGKRVTIPSLLPSSLMPRACENLHAGAHLQGVQA